MPLMPVLRFAPIFEPVTNVPFNKSQDTVASVCFFYIGGFL